MILCWQPPPDQSVPAAPPYRNREGERSRAALIAVVEQFCVEMAARYKPGSGGGATWCNQFVADVTDALGCPVPKALANDQAAWLGVEGREAGWMEASETVAATAAEKGYPVVIAWANPSGHGHVAMGVPQPEVGGRALGLRIAQAGARNFSNGSLVSGFGSRTVRFWMHQ